MSGYLPSEYIEYLKALDKLYSETTIDLDIEFEPLESIENFNRDIEIQKYAKGFYAFACDGGNEAYVFDQSGKVYLLPLIGMAPNAAQKLADSWQEFTRKILKNA